MTPHNHREFVPGCYRCELSQDEEERDADGVSTPPSDPEPSFGQTEGEWQAVQDDEMRAASEHDCWLDTL